MSSGELLDDRPTPGVALLTLNRPETLNAVTMDLQRELDAKLTELEADEDMRCIVLTGAGGKAFSAGYDVHEMAEWSQDELVASLLQREEWIWHWASTRLPVIAALNGLTYGVGAILATAVDMRIGCQRTVFRVTAGPHNGANCTWSLPDIVGRGLAADILMTSRKVEAAEGERIGLLNRVVPAAEVVESAVATAAQVAEHPPAGMQAIKRLLREGTGRSREDRFVAENILMRTELKPRPVGELYSDFLDK